MIKNKIKVPLYQEGDILKLIDIKNTPYSQEVTLLMVTAIEENQFNNAPHTPYWLKHIYLYLILESTNPYAKHGTITCDTLEHIENYYEKVTY